MIPIAQPMIDEKEKENVLEVMDNGMLAGGEVVKKFEEEFCSFINCGYGAATANGTTALHAALKAVGIEEGDQVLTTPFTFIATSNALLFCGAQPVFVDIKRDTFNLDPGLIEEKLQENPEIKALLIVHLYGQPCDMDRIRNLVEKYDIMLIEDCAQAHGASYDGRKVGTFGDVGVYSFYPTKNMTTSEGGIVVSDNKKVIERVRHFINHGATGNYHHEFLGYNYRMTNLEAAIGRAQLKKLTKFNQKRCQNARFFAHELQGLDWLQLPVTGKNRRHVFHLYTVRVKEREEFVNYLGKNDIGCGIYYPLPIYKQPLYKKRGLGNINLIEAESAAREVVSLPVHPALTKKECQHIVKVVKSFASRYEGELFVN
ncbi:MAG: DegT/DnrJ/EryC1/StrS family aminotransferase [Bacillota bacterium]